MMLKDALEAPTLEGLEDLDILVGCVPIEGQEL